MAGCRTASLAILGGTPAFAHPVLVGQPVITHRPAYFMRLRDALDRRWLSNNGLFVEQFERAIADRLGVPHVVATTSGTVALQLLFRALDLTGEVILPSFTFIATAHAVRWEKLAPVFCDVDPETHNIDPEGVERLITPRTTAILGVHLWGRACAIERLSRVARRHKLRLLFDAAHAFGCSHRGRPIGNFGDAEVFSFHATKLVTTAEGGAIVTKNRLLAERLRQLRRFGTAPDGRIETVGTNATMSEINAALGLTTLETLPQSAERNRRRYRRYAEALQGVSGIRVLPYAFDEQPTCPFVVLEFDADAPLDRNEVMAMLVAERVHTRAYFSPGCHNVRPYRKQGRTRRLPHTDLLGRTLLALPTGAALSSRQATLIAGIIRRAFGEAAAVRAAITASRSRHPDFVGAMDD